MERKPQFNKYDMVCIDGNDRMYRIGYVLESQNLGFMYHVGNGCWVSEDRLQLHEVANSPLYKLMQEEK